MGGIYLPKEGLEHAESEGDVLGARFRVLLRAHGDLALVDLEVDHDAGR